MSTYQSFSEIAPRQIWAGAVARPVDGERLTMALVDLDPNQDVPEHRHDNEQLGFVIEGSITMMIDGEARKLGPGETYRILSNVPHSARTGPEGATVIDVFAPIRADWAQVPRLQPAPARWPR